MAFTEFCCRSGGSNLNAGTRTGNSTEPGTSAAFTYASGSWVASTGVFTVASGNPSSDGVAVGDFASVYADGATVTGFVGRVTDVSSTTITVSLIARSGTAPIDGTNNRTLRIGGAWQGPNGASGFPFTFVQNAMRNVSGEPLRVNIKNDQTYNITAPMAMTSTNTGPINFQGYASTYGDDNRATIDGGTTGAGYNLLAIGASVTDVAIVDLLFRNNGATGNSAGVNLSGGGINRNLFYRCVVHSVRGAGLSLNVNTLCEECEVYGTNQSNGRNLGGIFVQGASLIRRCFVHDNTGSNNSGIVLSNNVLCVVENTVIESNQVGLRVSTANPAISVLNCDFYNNSSDGILMAMTSNGMFAVENSNFIENGGWGINKTGIGSLNGRLANNGFGTGTAANASGKYTGVDALDISGDVDYTPNVTPWTDPANGDFRISLAAAKGTGRGNYTQTQEGYAGTVAFPDIGAAQSSSSGGGGNVIVIED